MMDFVFVCVCIFDKFNPDLLHSLPCLQSDTMDKFIEFKKTYRLSPKCWSNLATLITKGLKFEKIEEAVNLIQEKRDKKAALVYLKGEDLDDDTVRELVEKVSIQESRNSLVKRLEERSQATSRKLNSSQSTQPGKRLKNEKPGPSSKACPPKFFKISVLPCEFNKAFQCLSLIHI